MFHAVRKAWASAREKRLFGLFAFEFFVVVLGVLTAQGVQSWVQERDKRQFAEEEQVRLEQGLLGAGHTATVWRAAIPCLRQRVSDIMRAAASGTSLDPAFGQRPKLVQQGYPAATPETNARIGARIGAEPALLLADGQIRVAAIQDAMNEMRMQWETFRLLDPQYGPVGSADRAAVRVAGAAIFSQLRSIEAALDMIEKEAPLVKAKRLTPFSREFGILPVRNCTEIWANGTIYRKIKPGEAAPY